MGRLSQGAFLGHGFWHGRGAHFVYNLDGNVRRKRPWSWDEKDRPCSIRILSFLSAFSDEAAAGAPLVPFVCAVMLPFPLLLTGIRRLDGQ